MISLTPIRIRRSSIDRSTNEDLTVRNEHERDYDDIAMPSHLVSSSMIGLANCTFASNLSISVGFACELIHGIRCLQCVATCMTTYPRASLLGPCSNLRDLSSSGSSLVHLLSKLHTLITLLWNLHTCVTALLSGMRSRDYRALSSLREIKIKVRTT